MPFAFDYLAHSGELFDAHSFDQVKSMEQNPDLKLEPVARFMLERMDDQVELETGVLQPYLGMSV